MATGDRGQFPDPGRHDAPYNAVNPRIDGEFSDCRFLAMRHGGGSEEDVLELDKDQKNLSNW